MLVQYWPFAIVATGAQLSLSRIKHIEALHALVSFEKLCFKSRCDLEEGG